MASSSDGCGVGVPEGPGQSFGAGGDVVIHVLMREINPYFWFIVSPHLKQRVYDLQPK